MVVLGDGWHKRRQIARLGIETMVSFRDIPAEVQTAWTSGGHKIDFFPLTLSNVADVQITGGGVEAVPPRVAQAKCPDLGQCTARSDEGIVGRNRVGRAAIGIDA